MDKLNQALTGLRPEERRNVLRELAHEIVVLDIEMKAILRLKRRDRQKLQLRATGHRMVYVIGAAGSPVKIGIATDPDVRLGQLQTGFPFPLKVLFSAHCKLGYERRVEAESHKALDFHRTNGEWFDVSPADAIRAVKAAIKANGGFAATARGKRYHRRWEKPKPPPTS